MTLFCSISQRTCSLPITANLLPPRYQQPAPAATYRFHFLFYSPANQEMLTIRPGLPGNEVVPGGYVDKADRQPIPDTFLDLPEAVTRAQAQGMRGKAEKAMLRVWAKDERMEGLMWLLWPISASTTYPVAALLSGQTTAACGKDSGVDWSDLPRKDYVDGTLQIDAFVLLENAILGNKNALAELHRCADRGDSEAMAVLGGYYSYKEDEAEATKWYRQAAEGGSADAMCNLGKRYAGGRGVPQNHTEAANWYLKSAERGSRECQFALGNKYMEGRGVPKDKGEAINWWRKAAEQGHADAQMNLGIAYENGDGVPKDLAEARRWYEQAASNKRADEELRNEATKARDELDAR